LSVRFKEKPTPWATGAAVLQYLMQRLFDSLAAGDYVRAESLFKALAAILPNDSDRETLSLVLSLDPEDPSLAQKLEENSELSSVLQDMRQRLQGLKQEHKLGYISEMDYVVLRNTLLAQMRVSLALDVLPQLKSLRDLLWRPEKRLG